MKFVPVTPSGTMIDWLVSDSEDEAWERLMKDAEHMPYKKENFIKRGYIVIQLK